MAAGLQLKNYLTSKDPEIKLQYQQRWLSFPSEETVAIKHLVSTNNAQALLIICDLYMIFSLGEGECEHWPVVLSQMLLFFKIHSFFSKCINEKTRWLLKNT